MVLRLDPDHPMVWRTPGLVQFGIERPVICVPSHSRVYGGLAIPRELMLDVLARGVTRPLLATLAEENGLPPAALGELLGELSAVLQEGEPPALPLDGLAVAVDGRGEPARQIAALLRRMGARLWADEPGSGRPEAVGTPGSPGAAGVARAANSSGPPARSGSGSASASRVAPDLAVVVSQYVTDPRRAAVWLRDDVPHLLVEFGEHSIRVGPVVAPGVGPDDDTASDEAAADADAVRSDPGGPCAHCIEHTRIDADPAWPAIAVQALRRTAPSADVLGAATAAPVVARVLAEFLGGDTSWRARAVRVHRSGPLELAVSVERLRQHPSCGCRSLPGNETAGGPRCAVIRPPPTTGRAVRERG